MKFNRRRVLESSKVLFITFTETSYSRSAILIGSTFKNSETIIIDINKSKLFQVKKAIKQNSNVDAVIVMSPCHLLSIYVRFFYRGRIILDAGWPLSDSIDYKDQELATALIKKIRMYLIDLISLKLSDLIYLESFQQLIYCHKKFFVPRSKLKVRYTGVLEREFNRLPDNINKLIHKNCKNCKIVVFRGKYNKAAGLEILSKVSMFIDSSIHLLILCPTLPEYIKFSERENVTVIREYLEEQFLEQIMSSALLIIGQLGSDSRLERTIPHKFFEAAFQGIPYLTPSRIAIREIVDERCVYFTENVDAQSIAKQINSIINNRKLLKLKAKNLKKVYESKLRNSVLTHNFMNELCDS